MNRSSVYRADFFRALVLAGEDAEARRAVCRAWGFREEKPKTELTRTPFVPNIYVSRPSDEPTKPKPAPSNQFRFLRCEGAERVTDEERKKRDSTVTGIMAAPKVTRQKLLEKEGNAPMPPPLMPWSRLGPFLRKPLSKQHRSQQPDIRKVVRLLAEGRALLRIPTVAKTKWHPRLEVWHDRRDDLAPFWDDAEFVRRRIIRERGRNGLKWQVVQRDIRSPNGFSLFDPSSLAHTDLKVPRGEATVLVIGDLGQYHPGSLQDAWLALGRKFSLSARKAWVLCPCPSHRWAIPMTRVWNMTQWDRGTRPARQDRGLPPLPENETAALEVFRLLCSAALRVEMGLLRQLRFLVPDGDVGLEHRLFSSKDVIRNSAGLSFKDANLPTLRENLPALSPEMAAECLTRIFTSHRHAPVYRHLEMMAWKYWLTDEQWRQVKAGGIITAQELDTSAMFYRGMLHSLRSRESGVSGEAMEAFLFRDLERLNDEARGHEERQVAWVLTQGLKVGGPLPDFIDPEVIRSLLPEMDCPPHLFHADGIFIGEEKKCGRIMTTLRERDGACVLYTRDEKRVIAHSGDRVLRIADVSDKHGFSIANDVDKVRIRPLQRPAWAKRMWYDKYGLAAEFRVKNVPFVLRWIPPGRFLMGSPEEEPGRWEAEGPRHERVVEKGFWLGETVVTQAQWLAVTGQNPSGFKGPETLPVELVSWQNCRDYCQKLAALVPELEFRLPKEQEWEYACRAGTDTALWTGGITIRKDYEAPELEEIAWYVGNSWKELQVENRHDMKRPVWRHPEGDEAGTHAVKGKKANPWGLYDMLGNVWEWCEDAWDKKAYEKQMRGELSLEGGDDADGVVRGGSWFHRADYCRAACRLELEHGFRGDDLGFRLAAGQELGSGATAPQRLRDDYPTTTGTGRFDDRGNPLLPVDVTLAEGKPESRS